jgi:hypothetical protein
VAQWRCAEQKNVTSSRSKFIEIPSLLITPVVMFSLDSQKGFLYSFSPRSMFLPSEVVRRTDLSCGVSRVEQMGDLMSDFSVWIYSYVIYSVLAHPNLNELKMG